MKTWQATIAKQHFSQVIDAVKEEPQLVIRRGEPVGVIISYQDYLDSRSLQEKRSLEGWMNELRTINEMEEDMPDIERLDREQPDWD